MFAVSPFFGNKVTPIIFILTCVAAAASDYFNKRRDSATIQQKISIENDLRERAGGGLEIHLLEKGGKHRWARVNHNSEAIVREYFDRARERGEDALVFPKGTLSNRVDIHACRAEYARDMYAIYESEGRGNGDLYICRNERKGDIYDKGILMLVSSDWGHSRCDVVVNHYMR